MKLTRQEGIKLAIKKLTSLGVPLEGAKKTAEVLIEAELRDDSSHGISCLLNIIESIRKGDIIPNKEPKIISEKRATAIVDGENILGPVSGIKAAELSIKKAKKYGISAISIRKSHHLFTLGYYTKFIALKNMVGILTTNTTPAMFAPGGLEKILGTNPISIGIPSKEKPIVIDMSSTNAARGKIKEAAKKGIKIPINWALDKYGRPTDDPEEALDGSLQPTGGYKGFALALAIDILSGILSGSASGKEVSGTSMHINQIRKAYKGDLLITIDISSFTDLDVFKSRVSALIKDIKGSAQGIKIHVPGEKAYKNKDNLIEIDNKLYKEIID